MYTNTAFCFVDLLSAYNSTLQTELPLTEIVPPTYNQSRSKNYIMCNKCLNKNTFTIDYKVLGPLIEEQIKKFKEQGDNQIVILIDRVYDDLSDINTLLKIAFDSKASVVLTVNKELNDEKTVSYCEYLSDIVFKLRQNESGFSKDVDGILSIVINQNGITSDSLGDKKTSIRYSLRDNNINFFTHLTV